MALWFWSLSPITWLYTIISLSGSILCLALAWLAIVSTYLAILHVWRACKVVKASIRLDFDLTRGRDIG
jgi:hypothetical protein